MTESIDHVFEGISDIDIHLEPKEYGREILELICSSLGYRFGSVILVDEQGVGSMFTSCRLPDLYPQLVQKVNAPVLSSPSGAALSTGETQVVSNITSDPRLEPWQELLEALEIKTIVWVPLFSKGKAFGTYNLYDRRQRFVSDTEKNLLRQLSPLFSLAIKNSEYIDEIRQQSTVLEAEVRERKAVEQRLRVAKEAAEAANTTKDEFLTAMSHELRTPMNAVMGFTDILLMDETDPQKVESLRTIRDSGRILLDLITGILDFSEIHSGHFSLVEHRFSLKGVMERVYRTFQGPAEEKNLLFELKTFTAFPPYVQGDELRVEQVISRIVENAVKFTDSGRIRLQCGYLNGRGIIKISDTGIGIPEEKRASIFGYFSQADMSSTRQHGGVGLGLTIAGTLTERMKGAITCDSTPGEGTTFTVELPLPEAPSREE